MTRNLAALVGAGALGAVAIIQHFQTPKHGRLVKSTYESISMEIPGSTTVYADHIDPGAKTRSALPDFAMYPDIVVKSQPGDRAKNTIIEVETMDGLRNDPAYAVQQLRTFRVNGYRRVLVVLRDGLRAARELLDDVPGKVHVRTPGNVAEVVV